MTKLRVAEIERADEIARKPIRKTKHAATDVEHDSLMPDSDFRAELGGISKMTLWRWDRDAGLAEQGFPPAIRIRERSYRSRRALELFKQHLLQQAARDLSARLRRGPKARERS
jgi:hypothetical protein